MSDLHSYNPVSVLLHWTIALLIVGLLSMGFVMTRMGDDQLSLKFELYQWHKSFGVTVLLLTCLRLGWRLSHSAPAPLETGFRKTAALATHILLYILTFMVPIAGWAMVSVSPWNIPTVLFEWVTWPHIPGLSNIDGKAEAESTAKLVHALLAYSAAALVLLHVAAALQHQFWFTQAIFKRMWFSSKASTREI